jgi:hypothetical protein
VTAEGGEGEGKDEGAERLNCNQHNISIISRKWAIFGLPGGLRQLEEALGAAEIAGSADVGEGEVEAVRVLVAD